MNTLSSLLKFIGDTIGAAPSTLTTTSKTLVGAINEIDSNPSIEEQGTSGIWEYRKWSDGTAECWGSTTEAKAFSQWGSVYSCDLTEVAFPTGLFIETPICMAAFGNGVAAAVTTTRGLPSKTHTFQAIAVRGTEYAPTITWTKNYYARGRWK